MNEFRIKNFHELHDVFSRYRKNNIWLFRGQGNPKWKLVPKAGRPPYNQNNDEVSFKAWKRRAIEFIDIKSNDDWDWLPVAQHHGLATRLLDWTYNPLAAAFFAVQSNDDVDAVIYAYLNKSDLKMDSNKPFEVTGINKVKPKGISQRITRQSGIFTVHNPPTLSLEESLEEDQLEKILIDKSYRPELLFELSHYGVNHSTLFPDLDGLSRHVNWYAENRDYWK